jgi:hypothetical protein
MLSELQHPDKSGFSGMPNKLRDTRKPIFDIMLKTTQSIVSQAEGE